MLQHACVWCKTHPRDHYHANGVRGFDFDSAHSRRMDEQPTEVRCINGICLKFVNGKWRRTGNLHRIDADSDGRILTWDGEAVFRKWHADPTQQPPFDGIDFNEFARVKVQVLDPASILDKNDNGNNKSLSENSINSNSNTSDGNIDAPLII